MRRRVGNGGHGTRAVARLLSGRTTQGRSSITIRQVTRVSMGRVQRNSNTGRQPGPFLRAVPARRGAASSSARRWASRSRHTVNGTVFLQERSRSTLQVEAGGRNFNRHVRRYFQRAVGRRRRRRASNFSRSRFRGRNTRRVLRFIHRFTRHSVNLRVLLQAQRRPTVVRPRSSRSAYRSVRSGHP